MSHMVRRACGSCIPRASKNAQALRDNDQFGKSAGLDLLRDLAAMRLDRSHRRPELMGDLLVHKSLYDQFKDLTFAWRQHIHQLMQRLFFAFSSSARR